MALDGIAVAAIAFEFNTKLANGKIGKIYQPEPDEIIMAVRCNGENYNLMLTANASHPRAHLVPFHKENPMQPPAFCMTLRKHLSNGRILSVTQPGLERILDITVESYNEMGDLVAKSLIIEIMGKHSNIILVGGNTIIDSIKRVSHDKSSVREVLPGRTYFRPPTKISPFALDEALFTSTLSQKTGVKLQNAIYQSFNGISPIAAAEICLLASEDPSSYTDQINSFHELWIEMQRIVIKIKNNDFQHIIYFDENSKPLELSCILLSVYGNSTEAVFDSASEMLDTFYVQKDRILRSSQRTLELRRLVSTCIERCVKKHDMQQKTLAEIANRDKYRIYGELLTANIYAVKKGMTTFCALNFYDGSELEIPLDPQKTSAENAQAYFKRYNKEKRTFVALQDQIKQNGTELSYLESVMQALSSPLGDADISEIRDELAEQGFVKKKNVRRGPKQKKAAPLMFRSSDGFEIYIGKNNKQNDELTLKFALGNDIWLHTKNIHGSHVIIRTNGAEVPDQTLLEAANAAACFSQARASSSVPVDYTVKKNVKKPTGSMPGMVIYEKNKTVYVTPDEDRLYSSLGRRPVTNG